MRWRPVLESTSIYPDFCLIDAARYAIDLNACRSLRERFPQFYKIPRAGMFQIVFKFLSLRISHYLSFQRVAFIAFYISFFFFPWSLEPPRKFTRTVSTILLHKRLILEISETSKLSLREDFELWIPHLWERSYKCNSNYNNNCCTFSNCSINTLEMIWTLTFSRSDLTYVLK